MCIQMLNCVTVNVEMFLSPVSPSPIALYPPVCPSHLPTLKRFTSLSFLMMTFPHPVD